MQPISHNRKRQVFVMEFTIISKETHISGCQRKTIDHRAYHSNLGSFQEFEYSNISYYIYSTVHRQVSSFCQFFNLVPYSF